MFTVLIVKKNVLLVHLYSGRLRLLRVYGQYLFISNFVSWPISSVDQCVVATSNDTKSTYDTFTFAND
jgi:hypothetical protein